MKAKITKRFVDELTTRDKEYLVWDESLPGFGLRVKPSGVKSYFAECHHADGRSSRVTLGRGDLLEPEDARQLARRRMAAALLGELRTASSRRNCDEPTFAQLAERYLRQHADVRKKVRSVHEDRRLLEKVILPRFRNMSVSSITRGDVTALHYKLVKTPIQANRVLALLSKIFNLAEAWELRPDGANPCRHVEKYPEKRRERYLSSVELARLGEATAAAERDGTEQGSALLAIRLILFTGARHNEVLSLRWRDVDFERGLLALPDSKTGRKDIVLAGPVFSLLEAARHESDSQWVIPGRGAATHLSTLNGPWRRLRVTAGIPDVRIHDLRHTYASTAVGLGLGLPVVAGLLGQTQLATTQRYAHLDLDPRRRAAEAVAAQLDLLLNGHDQSLEDRAQP